MLLKTVATPHQLRKVKLFLARDPVVNVLPLGDCYMPPLAVSKLFAAYEEADVVGVCSIYRGFSKPSVVLSPAAAETKEALLEAAIPEVSGEFITICDDEELDLFKKHASILNCEAEYQMIANPPKNPKPFSNKAKRVRGEEVDELDKFYREHHSEAWAPLQLKIGPFYCVRENGKIVSAAGTHLNTPQIAHLGSIVTDEAFRRRGFATACISRLTEDLYLKRPVISLFVIKDNVAAIRMYEKFGFKKVREIALTTLRAAI